MKPSPVPRRLDDQGPAQAGAPGRARCGGQRPHLPGHRHHGLPAQRRQRREHPGQRRPQVAPHRQALRPHCLSKLTLDTYLAPCTLLKSAPSVRNAGGRVVGFFRLGGVGAGKDGVGVGAGCARPGKRAAAEFESQGRGAVEASSPSRHSKRAAKRSTMRRAMFRQAVAAGEGALHTFRTRAASRISKSYTRLPWRLRA